MVHLYDRAKSIFLEADNVRLEKKDVLRALLSDVKTRLDQRAAAAATLTEEESRLHASAAEFISRLETDAVTSVRELRIREPDAIAMAKRG